MLKIGLEKKQSVEQNTIKNNNCGCNKLSTVKLSQNEKEKKLKKIAEKINKEKFIYKNKYPVF